MPLNLTNSPPGVRVTEGAAGLIPTELARHDRVYIIGTGAGGGEGSPDLYATPSQISSLDDAVDRFGTGVASTTGASIGLMFDTFPYAIAYFVRTPIGQTLEATIVATGATDDTLVLTVSGTVFTYTVDTVVDTDVATLTANLITAINDESSSINSLVVARAHESDTAKIAFRWVDPSAPGTFTIGGTGGASATIATDATALSPSLADYLWTIETAFDRTAHSQGFIAAPEAFATLDAGDRTALRIALESFASQEGFDWAVLVDGSPDLTPQAMADESKLFTSVQGHSTLPFYPYVVTLDGIEIPPSLGVAAIALKRQREQGFVEPPGGGLYPLPVAGLSRFVTYNEFSAYYQDVNFLREFPTQGVVVYGSRTRATDPRFLWLNARVITNIIIGTLRNEALWNSVIFSAIDGRGALWMRIKATIGNILYRIWQAGGLYGSNAQDAYAVIVDSQNNPNFDIQNGIVNADIYIAVTPTCERLQIQVNRVAIGEVTTVAAGFDRSRGRF